MAVDRRTVLAAGGAAACLGGGVVVASARASGPAVLIFDRRSALARDEAARARGHRLVALDGDPVRLWRDALAGHRGPVAGVTRWSDYLILRSLAEERRLRLRGEERVPVKGGAMMVRWRMS